MPFHDRVADLTVDVAAFAREMAIVEPAQHKYVIFFTPRSGSSWLTSILSATEMLGKPEEYINDSFVRSVAQATNSREQKGLLEILKRRRKSKNGVFGIEVTSTHVTMFGENEFFNSFEQETIVFHLFRDNLVAQGISLYRAVTTQRFHSTEDKAAVPDYDTNQIKRWIRHIKHIEDNNRLMMDRHGFTPRVLRYEDIVRSREITLQIFADAMKVTLPIEAKSDSSKELKKIGDEWNNSSESRFREEEKDFIVEIEAKRLIRS